jgi:hypothetical protein
MSRRMVMTFSRWYFCQHFSRLQIHPVYEFKLLSRSLDAKHPVCFIDATSTHMPKDNDDTQDIKLADLDGDGDLDMVIANETPPSRLLVNDGQGQR